jgi:Domain of unknown function (DUF4265)
VVSVDRAYAWGIATYLEHPSKASRWEDGRFVVHEDAQAEDCTVWFSLEPDDDEARWEGILGRRLAPDQARLCGIPLFVAGVNLGDEVSLVESGEGAPVAVEVVARSGNLTYRVLFPERAGQDERWHRLMVELEPLGCWFDVYGSRRMAISVPEARAVELVAYLTERTHMGELRFEAAGGPG